MNTTLSALLLIALLALAACNSDSAPQTNTGDSHDHAEGSSHPPHAEPAPETQAYYGDDEAVGESLPATNEAPDSDEHGHDEDGHGHKH